MFFFVAFFSALALVKKLYGSWHRFWLNAQIKTSRLLNCSTVSQIGIEKFPLRSRSNYYNEKLMSQKLEAMIVIVEMKETWGKTNPWEAL